MHPEFCARCGQVLDPSDEVVQAVETFDATTVGDVTRTYVDGTIVVVHARHFPPDFAHKWREGYRGMLRGLREQT